MDISSSFDSIRPTGGHGSITMMIKEVEKQTPDAQQELFLAVIDQLTNSARAMLRRFPKVREYDEHALVNEVYEALLKKLISNDIQNRNHFFATACNHFRWTLLDLVKRKDLKTEPLDENRIPAVNGSDEVEHTEFLLFAMSELDKLPNQYRAIVESSVFLGLSFQEIAVELAIPKSTVHDHYRKAIELLRSAFSGVA